MPKIELFEMDLNKVHNINFLDNTLPDKCANLIIVDPPYFEVKGKFDFIWSSFEHYLKDVELWAKECKRLLTDNGTLFWWGHAKKIAYSQIILDKYFNLENSLVWEKLDCQTKRQDFAQSRCFAPTTERVLMYSNEVEMTGLEAVKLNVENFKTLRNYFECLQKSLNIPKKEFLNRIGQSADHCFRWGSTQWDLPTELTYGKLISTFSIDLLEGFKPYEVLRQEYEVLRRPFDNVNKYTDVLRFSQESHITKSYDHDTVKPEKLTRALTLTCSRKNDLVVVPFAGSGTECAVALEEGRRCIGFDIEIKYVEMSNKRIKYILDSPKLNFG